MVARLIIVTYCLILYSCGTSQTTVKQEQIRDLNISASKMYVDGLDQLYVLSSQNEIIKYDNDLIERHRYNDNTLGEISLVNVYNPLNIMVYYADYGTIVYLDNTLSVVRSISLNSWEYFDIEIIAASNDGNIWLYDPSKNRLVKCNEQGQELLSSNNLNDFGIGEITPIKIIEQNNKVWLLDETNGILVFDNLGGYIKRIPFDSQHDFQIDGDHLVYWDGDKIQIKSFKLLEHSQLNIPQQEKWNQVIISPKHFYMMDKNGINRSARK